MEFEINYIYKGIWYGDQLTKKYRMLLSFFYEEFIKFL